MRRSGLHRLMAAAIGLMALLSVSGGCSWLPKKSHEAPPVSDPPPTSTAPASTQSSPQLPQGQVPASLPQPVNRPVPSRGSSQPQAPSPVSGGGGGAPAPATSGDEARYFIHTVKFPGESISIIAGWYTGDIQNWEAIADSNPAINPNRIVQKNRIQIPESIMVRKDPMTREFVDSFYPKGTGKARAHDPPPPEEEPELFGPKK